MNALTLRARWETGSLPVERVPAAAEALLLNGADSPAVRVLAGLVRPTQADVAPLVNRLFAELHVPQVDPDRAWRIAARDIAAEAIAGTITPIRAAGLLADLRSESGWTEDLEAFMTLLHSLDDGPEARASLDTDILDACEWLLTRVDVP